VGIRASYQAGEGQGVDVGLHITPENVSRPYNFGCHQFGEIEQNKNARKGRRMNGQRQMSSGTICVSP
jgi:hypothetical protein